MKTKKSKVIESPRLGLIDPDSPTSVIDLVLDENVETYINEVSKQSNHTISSVVTILLTMALIEGKATLKKAKARKGR